jgi:citrate lyase gamma subunit
MTFDDAIKELIKAKLTAAQINLDDVGRLDSDLTSRISAIIVEIETILRSYNVNKG